jgi:hypothetical protein
MLLMPKSGALRILETQPRGIEEHEFTHIEFIGQTTVLLIAIPQRIRDEAFRCGEKNIRDFPEQQFALDAVALHVG